jgi:hypothetical protein
MGTPASEFKVIFDTGSSVIPIQWLWIPGPNCKCHKSPNRLEISQSSTYLNLNISRTLHYNKGRVEGSVCQESVSLNTKDSVKDQKFILANADKGFENLVSDGILV